MNRAQSPKDSFCLFGGFARGQVTSSGSVCSSFSGLVFRINFT